MRIVLIILLPLFWGCRSNNASKDIYKKLSEADSLYACSIFFREYEPLIKSKELYESISVDSLNNYINSRLSIIYFYLGEDSLSLSKLYKIDDSFWGKIYKKNIYILSLKAFILYKNHRFDNAKDTLSHAIRLLDEFILKNPKEGNAVTLKFILKTQVHDADLDSVYKEFDYLPSFYIHSLKTSYPTKLHYRFALSGRKDFTTFLFEELDKIEDIEYE